MIGNMSATDWELLQQYRRNQAETAFTELVRRHVNLVYSAALRQVRAPQLAEEIAQSVFSDLARQADRLRADTVLPAWLHQVTRRAAIDVVRREARRQLREQTATEMNAINAPDASWTHIEPLLDEAVSALDDADRAAVVLRYFENKSLREVGQQLGVSDDAAQKRVSRAVERLREFFAKRGVAAGASGLAVVISANAVQAAPVGLALTIPAAVLTGTTLATTATVTATKAIAMTVFKKTIVTATIAVLAGVGIYEARQAAQLREQVQKLKQQQAPLVEQIQRLENEGATTLATSNENKEELERLRKERTELLRLRGEVGLLRKQVSDLFEFKEENLRLRASLAKQSEQTSQTTTEVPSDFPRDSWAFAGYATPEATLLSWTWAGTRGDRQAMIESLAPEAQEKLQQALAKISDAELARQGTAGASRISSYRILGRELRPDGGIDLTISIIPTSGQSNLNTMTFQKYDEDWKLVGPLK